MLRSPNILTVLLVGAFFTFAALPAVLADIQSAPAGSVLRLVLNDEISSLTAKPGDRFTATVVQDVRVDDRVVVPVGTQVRGRIGAVRDYSLTLQFDMPHAVALTIHDPIPGTTHHVVGKTKKDRDMIVRAIYAQQSDSYLIQPETDGGVVLTSSREGVELAPGTGLRIMLIRSAASPTT